MEIYNEGTESGMTEEQQDKFDKLIEMGWEDVAAAYLKECKELNCTKNVLEGIFTSCRKCGKSIKYGNAYMSITKEIVQVEEELDPTSNLEHLTMIDSCEVISLCGKCGSAFDESVLEKRILDDEFFRLWRLNQLKNEREFSNHDGSDAK